MLEPRLKRLVYLLGQLQVVGQLIKTRPGVVVGCEGGVDVVIEPGAPEPPVENPDAGAPGHGYALVSLFREPDNAMTNPNNTSKLTQSLPNCSSA